MVRIKLLQKTWIYSLCLFILLPTLTTLPISITSAQTEPSLIIHIYDANSGNESMDFVLFEGKSYNILVSAESVGLVIDANISLLGNTYTTSAREPSITFLAPDVNDSKSLIIIATKEGYLAAESKITLVKGKLSIITNQEMIEEKKVFQVTVINQDNKPVEGAFVYITSRVTPEITNPQGIASIRAPDVEKTTTATIEVIKNGYVHGLMNIQVENIGGFVLNINEIQLNQILLLIILAIFTVNFTIFYIIWHKKRKSTNSNQTTRNKQSAEDNVFQSEKQLQKIPAIYFLKDKRNIFDSSIQSSFNETKLSIQKNEKETTDLYNEQETQSNLNELRTIIKIDQPSQKEYQKNEDEIPVLKKDLEEKKEYLKAVKDFDFRINENKEKIEQIEKKVISLSGDLDDLVSLYEIVSDQMNPFVGLSRVTKDRIDALEHYTEEIKELKTRLEQLELSNSPRKMKTDITSYKGNEKEKHTNLEKQDSTTTSHIPIQTTDNDYSDQELDAILDESFIALQPLRTIEQEIIDLLDKLT